MKLKLSITVLLLLALAVTPQASERPRSERPDTYFTIEPGLEFTTASDVKRDGQTVSTRTSVTRALSPVEIDGLLLQHRRSKSTRTSREGSSFTGSYDYYQLANEEMSCTYAYGATGEEPSRAFQYVDHCLYIDLKAPVRVGATWKHESPLFLYNPDLYEMAPSKMTSTVQGFESVTVGDVEFSNCVVLHEHALVNPAGKVTCTNGDQSLTDVKLERYRWLCPGLPDIKETTTELYFRRSNPDELCTTMTAKASVTEVVAPESAPDPALPQEK